MKSFVKLLIAGLLWLSAYGASQQLGGRDQIQFVASASTDFLPIASDNNDQPPPCKCKCGGEIKCQKGQWAYCECKDGKCDGSCTTVKQEPYNIAADVVSVLEKKQVTAKDLQGETDKYSHLLRQLLNGKVADGIYRITYNDHEIGFSFTKPAISLLNEAVSRLEKQRVIDGKE